MHHSFLLNAHWKRILLRFPVHRFDVHRRRASGWIQWIQFLLAAFVALSTGTGCSKSEPESQTTETPPAYFATEAQDETTYLVQSIITDLAQMAAYLNGSKNIQEIHVTLKQGEHTRFRNPEYSVTVTGPKEIATTTSILLDAGVWAPETYMPFAKQWFKPPTKASDVDSQTKDLNLLEALTHLRAGVIQDLNKELSAQLTEQMDSASLHSRAAVLLGAFALRENAGVFSDIRSPLSRMTAHLCVAQALSPETSQGLAAQVARILLQTLSGNQVRALDMLKTLRDERALDPWRRTLEVRNSMDYRRISESTNTPATRLELITAAWAIAHAAGAEQAWQTVPRSLQNTVSDFVRIALSESPTVDLGHRLLRIGLSLESDEVSKILASFQNAPKVPQKQNEFLNLEPDLCVVPQSEPRQVWIVGPGQWGAFLQRHWMHVIQKNYRFLRYSWSVPEYAAQYRKKMISDFKDLRLIPFFQRYSADSIQQYREAVDAGTPVIRKTPYLISALCYNNLYTTSRIWPRYSPVPNPHVNEWFRHDPIPGTVYDIQARLNHPSLVGRRDVVSQLSSLQKQAPYDFHLISDILERGTNWTEIAQQAQHLYAPLLAYSPLALKRLAQQARRNEAMYEATMLKAAEFDPGPCYFALGSYFSYGKDREKTRMYYERAVAAARDEVLLSNNSYWLVHDYFHQGEKAKAEELADRAASTYSFQGLETKASLMELEHNYAAAIDYYSKIEERYNSSGPITGFYVRYKAETGDTQYDPEVERRMETLFPSGLEKVTLASFSSPPSYGIDLKETSEALTALGIKKGDCVVAVDGIRIFDTIQYTYVRDRTNSGPMKLILWNGSQYVEKSVNLPKRRLGVPIHNHVIQTEEQP